MIKTLTAHTAEIDDAAAAVAEIMEQLGGEKSFLKNSVGLLSCYSEFIDSGVVKAVCEKLPFDVIGTTTLGNAVPQGLGQMVLSITVLTSDDVVFSCGVTEALNRDNFKKNIEDTYNKAAAALPDKPKMLLAFAPLTFDIAGDYVVETLDAVSGSIPIFGTLSVDHTVDYSAAKTVFDGEAYKDRLSMLLFFGDIDPLFSIASVSDEKILGQKAVITSSCDNILKGTNDLSVIDYLQSIGLAPNGKLEGLNAIPFIIDFNDGTKPVTRAIFAITPEGHAVCGGVMPANATLGIGYIDHDEVLATTKNMMDTILNAPQKNGVIIFSCIVRNLVLGFDVLAEMETVQQKLKEKLPYFLSYSGGEMCPVYNEDGKPVNRFHNDTIVTMLF